MESKILYRIRLFNNSKKKNRKPPHAPSILFGEISNSHNGGGFFKKLHSTSMYKTATYPTGNLFGVCIRSCCIIQKPLHFDAISTKVCISVKDSTFRLLLKCGCWPFFLCVLALFCFVFWRCLALLTDGVLSKRRSSLFSCIHWRLHSYSNNNSKWQLLEGIRDYHEQIKNNEKDSSNSEYLD